MHINIFGKSVDALVIPYILGIRKTQRHVSTAALADFDMFVLLFQQPVPGLAQFETAFALTAHWACLHHLICDKLRYQVALSG